MVVRPEASGFEISELGSGASLVLSWLCDLGADPSRHLVLQFPHLQGRNDNRAYLTGFLERLNKIKLTKFLEEFLRHFRHCLSIC